MAAIDNIISINITQSSTAVPTVSTTIPLILGTTNPGWADGDVVHAYESAAGLLADGFTATSPEYVYALALTSQSTIPNEFLVGRRSGATTAGEPEIDRISVGDVEANHVYTFTLNGRTYSYTSGPTDSAQIIVQGLHDSVAADTAATVTASLDNNGLYLILTGTVDGQAFTMTGFDSALVRNQVQGSSAAEAPALATSDLAAIQAQDDSWYGLLLAGASDAEIMTAASWVQAQRKILVGCSSSSEIGDPQSTTDLGAKLKSGSFSRTALMYSPASAALGIEAAWVGGQLPQTPGTNNWAFRSLLGQQVDKLTAASSLACIGNPVAGVAGKNVNTYISVGGQGITQMGTCGSGEYIDVTVGVDWLFFNLQSTIYSALVNTPGKVPFTDAGMAILVAATRAVLDTAAANGLVDATQGITIKTAKVATVTQAQKAQRRAPAINFTCVLQGAINAVTINGTVSV